MVERGRNTVAKKKGASKEEAKESHRRVKRDAEDRGAWDQSLPRMETTCGSQEPPPDRGELALTPARQELKWKLGTEEARAENHTGHMRPTQE